MKITFLNVGHGACTLLVHENGNVMLFDCGRGDEFQPSTFMHSRGYTGIERLVISNYDEDHMRDLPRLRELCASLPISMLRRNTSISAEQLRALKMAECGQIGPGMNAMLQMIEEFNNYNLSSTQVPAFPNLELETFSNPYPTFTDTNNLSLVSFIHYDGMSVVLPGDLENAGWKELLKNPSFRQHLSRVTIFQASHHGRESGYCEEVFNYCSPEVVIISDTEIKHETQADNGYREHARGVQWPDGTARFVLTTRSDGHIQIQKTLGSGAVIYLGASP